MADTNRTEVPTAWLIRAGKNGEREDFVLEHGLAFGGWDGLPDLSGVSSRADMEVIVRRLLPGNSKMSVANYVGQPLGAASGRTGGRSDGAASQEDSSACSGRSNAGVLVSGRPEPRQTPRRVGGLAADRGALVGCPRGSPRLAQLTSDHLFGQVR